MTDKLKPCPFCGSTKFEINQKMSSNTKYNPKTKRLEKFVVVTVRCNKCHTRGPTTSIYAGWNDRPTQMLKEKAIEVWNRRADNDEMSV